MTDIREWTSTVGLENELGEVLSGLANACATIARTLRTAPLAQLSGSAGSLNVQGEAQKPLDIISNEVFVNACRELAQISLAVSEEEEDPIPISATGSYAVVFDPLDGSSNLDVNVTVGSIFSVVSATTPKHILPGGRPQHIAGFASYGPSTDLTVLAKGRVARFTLDASDTWRLVELDMRLPDRFPEIAINAARADSWDDVIRGFVNDAFHGNEIRYNARWVASLVAETQRILSRGGLFLYPADSSGRGRLRLLYEARPIAAIVEAAGGRCSTGFMPILEVNAETLHDRVPLIFGGASQVEALEAAYRADKEN
ncbi:fructose-1,6-bisphosphatase (plasmid) [Rhizobium sp. CB3060]|uniref:Fructose-1,6-bisphosphatase class 1 n=1 Tax=Rhizobium sp. TAL1145 TaxID=147233 RepID=Q84HW6_9HYPH|nr:class 1 fructose-bisphosphatase [Rhizobium tropici]AAO18430.1 fructose 1,6 bisphosphatase [Rhizobium sp. TAL1145]UWU26134.1 fructose-1,6-bisphosphatase [Rhizobium tropici]